jgi:hypothetical protein
MFRVRYQCERQAPDFHKCRTDTEAALFAALKISATNGPLMLRITFKGRVVFDYER